MSRSLPVTLVVTDALGRELRRLTDGEYLQAGSHTRVFSTSGLPPGVYFLRLLAEGSTVTKRMLHLQ
jgi:hypothetical protein